MKNFFGYIRVSTAKQGEHGVSLQEQRDAIARHAERHGLEVVAWFEERQTAAKRGRPVFNQMLRGLKQSKADGVIIHKIDRSARNLKDWADLGELIDQGVEVHFANESLDLHSRGGRLSADIQAVVAADYIRNLREETRKGFYGRLKQGMYPLPAPIGYLDGGKGKPKERDPGTAPLVRLSFELYASGRYNLDSLVDELWRRGLRNKRAGRVSRNGLSRILNNPFYIGLIRLRRTGETFPGAHAPLIPKSLFDRVQRVLTAKTNTRTRRHDFLFRRLLACRHCRYTLIGETQKGHVYYRCHTPRCPTTGIREEAIEAHVTQALVPLRLSDAEKAYAESKVAELRVEWLTRRDEHLAAAKLTLSRLQERLARLTDAYVDRLVDRETFEERKTALLLERQGAQEIVATLARDTQAVPDRLAEFLELAGSAYSSYELAIPDEKRDLLGKLTSNLALDDKTVVVTLKFPFTEIANRLQYSNGGPYRDVPRTWDQLIGALWNWCKANPGPALLALGCRRPADSGLDDNTEIA